MHKTWGFLQITKTFELWTNSNSIYKWQKKYDSWRDVCERVQNIMWKEENAGNQHFLLFPHKVFRGFLSNWSLTLSQTTKFTLFQTESKLKEFSDDNFKFDGNDRKLSKLVENTVGEREIARFSFSHSVFKRLVLQTRKNQGLFGKGLKDGAVWYKVLLTKSVKKKHWTNA